MDVKPCSRCGAEPIVMGADHNVCFEISRGYGLLCPVCKKFTGYFADEKRTIQTWNEMNTDAP